LDGREIIKTNKKKFLQYNRYGKNIIGLECLPLSGYKDSNKEIYLIHFKPESRSNLHLHNGSEEFFVLDGELIDEDGERFVKGDFVRFLP